MSNLIYPVLAVLAGIGGIFTGQGLLLLLGVVLLLTTAFSFLLVRKAAGNLNLQITAPAVVGKRSPFRVTVELTGGGKVPVGPVRMKLVCRNLLTGVTAERKLKAGGSFILKEDCCGCVELALEAVRIFDWTGVLSVPFRKTSTRRVLVMPDTFPLEAAPQLSFSNLMDSEEYSPYKKGQDPTETFQIREYVPGDSLRQIHWKLSSKMDRLIVREASLPVDPSLLLFWDKRTEGSAPEVCDALCEAFVSLAQAYAEAGISFRMAWNGEVIHTADITGPEQLPEAVADLMKTEIPDPALSGAELYAGTAGGTEAGQILYLADRLPSGLANAAGQAETLLLLCGNSQMADEITEEGIPVLGFTPESMETDLQSIWLE